VYEGRPGLVARQKGLDNNSAKKPTQKTCMTKGGGHSDTYGSIMRNSKSMIARKKGGQTGANIVEI
jgi:hypothetical protein